MVTRLNSRTRLHANPSKIASPELVREFEQVMDKEASNVIYIRLNRHIKHECWQTIRQQPRGLSVCPICYGTGYDISIERHLCRDWSQTSPGRQALSNEAAEPGKLQTPFHSFVFLPKVRPNVEDMIYRVEWHPVTELPIQLIQMYKVDRVLDQREEQGVLVYYKVFGTATSANYLQIENLLRNERRIKKID